MSNIACGSWACPDEREIIDERPLSISFELLEYHSLSSRMLTFDEYKRLSTKECFLSFHEYPLFIIENSDFSILYLVTSEGHDLERAFNLRWLMQQ